MWLFCGKTIGYKYLLHFSFVYGVKYIGGIYKSKCRLEDFLHELQLGFDEFSGSVILWIGFSKNHFDFS